MKVRDLIKELLDFNPDADVSVRLHSGQRVGFSLAFGATHGEGITKEETSTVSIYVDHSEGSDTNQEKEEIPTSNDVKYTARIVSDCCSYDMLEPDWDMAENAGSLWRAYVCYICKKCEKPCTPIDVITRKEYGK